MTKTKCFFCLMKDCNPDTCECKCHDELRKEYNEG